MKEKWRIFKGEPKEKEKLVEIIERGRITGTLPEEESVGDFDMKEPSDIEKLQGDTEAEAVFKKVFPPLESKRDEKEKEKSEIEHELAWKIKDFNSKRARALTLTRELEDLEKNLLNMSPESPKHKNMSMDIFAKEKEFDEITTELGYEQRKIDKLETKLLLAKKKLERHPNKT